MKNKLLSFLLFACIWVQTAAAQQKNYTVSGNIKDAKNGEDLIGASISVPSLKLGVSTNSYGFYSITLPAGSYTLEVSYIGFETILKEISLNQNILLNLELIEAKTQLQEVIVKTDKANNSNVSANKTSVIKIDIKQVKKIPTLLGEVDIIKAIQLLPGIQAAGDGSTNFIVRGGNIDHNLVQLDEAVVYNPSHVLGFFSVFNGDAIKDFEIYKGGIPAQYGGRLASVLDVHMKDGNSKNYVATGGIGLLSSRLTLEGPIVKGKSSFLISGRRSYFDVLFPFTSQLKDVTAYFGDLNLKANYILGDKDKIYLSGYLGRDKLAFSKIVGFGWGNYTGTLRWNHVFNSKLFVNTSLVYSRYNYNFDINLSDNLNFTRSNFIDDLNLKIDGSYFVNNKNSVKFGIKLTNYVFQPGKATKITDASIFEDAALPKKRAIEEDFYASHSHKFNARLIGDYGARISVFSNIGLGRSINYVGGTPTYIDGAGTIRESQKEENNLYTTYKSGEIYKTYIGFEPRATVTYLLNEKSSLKASYNRMYQYMNLIQNITASVGQEFWTPTDNYIKPQMADQVAVGYFKNFLENTLEFSVEVYYKKMKNTVELRDGANVQFNEAIESQVVAGQGRAYGLELFLRKQTGKTTGWVGYTLAKSERQADHVNQGKWYPFRFDKRNYLTIVLSHDITPRLTISGNFIYATGEAFSIASQRYSMFGAGNPSIYYSARNSARFPAYHRMDLSLIITRKKIPGKVYKNNSDVVIAVYNVYGRKNAYTLSYQTDPTNNVPLIYKWYLFTFVPSITYNFKF
ncbi:MAG: TonB-dependent receptor [Bacteroidia bacterium]|nr:TonB-dependent receptor [Bacteroidia bacterium]